MLATCRRHQNHGKFNGSIEEQFAILELAVRNGAHAIDVEIETAEAAQDRLSQFRGRAQVIVSYHNFEATPPMDTVVNRVMKVQADAYKIVTTARKPSDNVRVLAAAKALPKQRMVVLAMGELGFPTRVLSPVFGGVYTYAAPMCAEGTAAGQVSARYLRHLYRVEKLRKGAKIYGVIADPIRHSISPAVHNRAFQSRRVDAVYLPFLVSPALPARLLRDGRAAAARRLQRHHPAQAEDHPLPGYGGSAGPAHRRREYRWRKAGKWRGTNTDAAGVTGPLSPPVAPAERLRPDRRQWRRGARRGLRADRCRRENRAGRPQCRPRPRAGQDLRRRAADARTVRTAASSTPSCTRRRSACSRTSTSASSTATSRATSSSTWSTTRMETLLLQRAREQGKTVVPGLDMFIEQAVRQFEIWTGDTAPRSVMQKAALEALEAQR